MFATLHSLGDLDTVLNVWDFGRGLEDFHQALKWFKKHLNLKLLFFFKAKRFSKFWRFWGWLDSNVINYCTKNTFKSYATCMLFNFSIRKYFPSNVKLVTFLSYSGMSLNWHFLKFVVLKKRELQRVPLNHYIFLAIYTKTLIDLPIPPIMLIRLKIEGTRGIKKITFESVLLMCHCIEYQPSIFNENLVPFTFCIK